MKAVAVVGAGPAGLMAAEVIAAAGYAVEIFDAMPSVARKFLRAGVGGLNLTHSEPADAFLARYGPQAPALAPHLADFDAQALRAWAKGLGIDTFVGSSGRVFPVQMKAAPLLRAWLKRLSASGVRVHPRHRWRGWDQDARQSLLFSPPSLDGASHITVDAPAVVLALGGASWAKLGSNGAWANTLQARGVALTPFAPSNCGFDMRSPRAPGTADIGWSTHLSERYAGQPLKPVVLSIVDGDTTRFARRGECLITRTGLEGGLIYAASAALRARTEDHLKTLAQPSCSLDLLPDWTPERVAQEAAHPRGSKSLASHLKSRLHLDGPKAALLFELLSTAELAHAPTLAARIKALPLTFARARPIDEAISTAGGVAFDGLDETLMLRALPGVFCAGEMLDWDAPTGGYLLTAAMATGRAAGQGVVDYLRQQK